MDKIIREPRPNKNELITIGIPVYNAELYIKQCLLSVLNQTYPEIEILIIDDKGTDTSMDIVRSIKAEHPRGGCIRIIENSRNQGVGISKSKLIENALGDYFFFLDDDDEISSDCIKLMYDKIISTNVDMICGSHQICYENKIEDFVIKGNVVRGKNILIEFFRSHNSMYIWNKLYKTSLLKEHHIYYSGRFLEDVNMSFQVFAAIQSCCDLSDITYFHHSRPTSFSLNYDGKKNINIVLALDSFFLNAYVKIQTLNSIYRIKIKEKFCATRLLFCSWVIGGIYEEYIKFFLNPAYLQDKDIWKSPILFSFYIFSLIPLGIQKKIIPLLLTIKKQINRNKP
jgi:glycosyltransferase involved in cell wall biosynthesis